MYRVNCTVFNENSSLTSRTIQRIQCLCQLLQYTNYYYYWNNKIMLLQVFIILLNNAGKHCMCLIQAIC